MADVEVDTDVDNSTKLLLQEIKKYGGDEEDLQLVDEDDDAEEIIEGDDSDSDDEILSKLELREFIKKLGFKSITNKLTIIKDEDNDENNDTDDDENEKAVEVVEKDQVVNVKKSKLEKKLERDEKYKVATNNLIKSNNVGPPKEPKKRNYMLLKPQTKWYENEIVCQADKIEFTKLSLPDVMEFENYAAKLLQHDVELYQKYQRSSKNRSDFGWIQTVLKSGTISDIMAARITLVQDSPVHNLSCLDQLIKMIDVKRKKECLHAIDTLKELFLGDLLLEDKKLRPFDQQPLGSLNSMSGGDSDVFDKLLILWSFESILKQKYSQFVSAVVKISHDSVDANKRKSLKVMFELLLKNPEQEQILLSSIVNKLGDPNHKIASQTSYFLCRLLDKHPTMKGIVVNEVERLLFRSNVTAKASYFAICFLNQIILDHEDKAVASKLTSIYFSLFKGASKKGEVDSKMMTALLTGANRAFPFAKLDSTAISEDIDSTYKLIPTMNFNIGVQALTLLYHILDSKGDFSDRFYCSLYRKLLDPELKSTSKQTIFINLLYKSLKRDNMETRLHAFIKRIFQVAQDQMPSMACGLLFMISEILRLGAKKLPLTLEGDRWDMDDDEDERFKDVPEDETEIVENQQHNAQPCSEPFKSKQSWVHRVLQQKTGSAADKLNGKAGLTYDPLHRNPLYAISGKASFLELTKLAEHNHPSVSLFARTLLEGRYVNYSGDPLQDFTLTRFLDRFVYRNPKKQASKKDEGDEVDTAPVTSQMSILGKRSRYQCRGVRAISVNSEVYVDKPEAAIPVDERFIHKYFSSNKLYADSVIAMHGKKDEDDDDIESVASDEFDDMLSKFEEGNLKRDYELDFAAQMKKGLNPSGKKSKSARLDEEDDDEDEANFENDDFDEAFKEFDDEIEEAKAAADDDDLESDDGNDGDFDAIEDSKENDEEFSEDGEDNLDDDDDEEEDDYPQPKKQKRSKEENTASLFAAAEDFAAVIEENAEAGESLSGLDAFANKDNAHMKQLRWESDRDKWVRGVDWKSKKRQKSSFSKKPASGRKGGKFAKRKGRK